MGGDAAVALGVGVNGVRLVQLRHSAHPLEQEGQQRQTVAGREVAVNLAELGGVALAVVGRQLHAGKEHAHPLAPGLDDHRLEVLFQFAHVQAAQAVVGAQGKEQHLRPDPGVPAQPRRGAGRGGAADAAVDHPHPGVAVAHKHFAKQVGIGFLRLHTQACGERIAEKEHGRPGQGRCGQGEPKEQEQGRKRSGHGCFPGLEGRGRQGGAKTHQLCPAR